MTLTRNDQVLYANAIGASQNNTQPIQTLDYAPIAISTIAFIQFIISLQFLDLK